MKEYRRRKIISIYIEEAKIMSVKYQTKLKARCAFVLCIILACFIGPHPVLALSKKYAEPGPYGVGSKKVTIARTGVGFFDATVYFPTAASAGGRCTNVATCYLQSMATSQNQELAAGKFQYLIEPKNVCFGGLLFKICPFAFGAWFPHVGPR